MANAVAGRRIVAGAQVPLFCYFCVAQVGVFGGERRKTGVEDKHMMKMIENFPNSAPLNQSLLAQTEEFSSLMRDIVSETI